MDSSVKVVGSYVVIVNDDDGSSSTFPNPNYDELAWRLIYGDGDVSREDRVVAASILNAYHYMTLEATGARRNEVVRKLRAAQTVPSGSNPTDMKLT